MAESNCPTCGQPITDPEAAACPNCGAVLAPRIAAGGAGGATGETAPPGVRSSIPFEDLSRPFFQRLFETVKLALSNPARLFADVPASTDILPAVVYGVILGTLGGVSSLLWQMMFGGLATLAEGAASEEFMIGTGFMILAMFMSPVFVAVGLFISAGIYHLMLLLLGDGSRGFGVTLRAVAYGQTPGILAIIPICGGVAGGIWSLVLVIMGAYYGHRTDGWRAILAYFLPLIVCCGAIAGLAVMMGFIGAVAN